MKCKIPEISWHNRDPVLSVDIQPNYVAKDESTTTICRLASSGTDAHVLIWYINRSAESGDIELDLAADLSRHQRAVNTVRWSPNGELLASGDDESVVFIWKLKGENEVVNIVDDTNEQDKEVWVTLKVLRGHTEDIYDLSWSPNSQFLVTGSVDNTAIMWDVHKGKSIAILSDHKGYVQGVAWDPKNQYIATMCTDRHMRVFDIHSKKVLHRIVKSTLPVPEDSELHMKDVRLYHDGTLQTFFRRLCFTPDGKLLLTPAGVIDYDGVVKPINTTYAFSRYEMRQPVFVLPEQDQYTIAVRCSPLLYKLREYNPEKNPPIVALPYRMIFAVATRSSVYFYDTQQKHPLAGISDIHYTRLTDLTWSSDGRVVIVSSTDGFCSLITFSEGELGDIYEDTDAVLGAAMICENTTKNANKKFKKSKTRKSSQDEINGRKQQYEHLIGIREEDGVDELNASLKTDNLSTVERKLSQSESSSKENETHSETAENEIGKLDPKPIAFRKGKEATPIAIKRKPGIPSTTDESKTTDVVADAPAIESTEDPNSSNKVPETESIEKIEENLEIKAFSQKSNSSEGKNLMNDGAATQKHIEIILDKEILSSEEKFGSPEKKSRPVTPIFVRRHPRTPNSATVTPTATQTTKRATPIAIRRTPRVLIATPVNTPIVIEEAMDAWPLMEEGVVPIASLTASTMPSPPTASAANIIKTQPVQKQNSTTNPQLTHSETTSELTEDIRLVYEDTVDEASTTATAQKSTESPSPSSSVQVAKATGDVVDANVVGIVETIETVESTVVAKPQTPLNRTPRRVALTTISTPKSKKKLLGD